ncbi:MAG: YlmH/Sll1252 family protein [Eubacteriales bacterium]
MEKEDYQLLSRLDDYIHLALYKNTSSCTRFLNPHEQSVAIQKLKAEKVIQHKVFGGFEGSERNIIIIYPDNEYIEAEDDLSAAKIIFTKYDTKYINHRMILGSVLSLGIKRDGLGDIIIDKNTAYIIATKQMGKYICDNLLQIGRAHVSTEYIDNIDNINLSIKEPATITGTIASLRIDCILALALKTSRSKAAEMISNQMVYLNWQLVTKTSIQVEINQIITIRKKGRVILKDIGSNSRKNRIWVELQVYL